MVSEFVIDSHDVNRRALCRKSIIKTILWDIVGVERYDHTPNRKLHIIINPNHNNSFRRGKMTKSPKENYRGKWRYHQKKIIGEKWRNHQKKIIGEKWRNHQKNSSGKMTNSSKNSSGKIDENFCEWRKFSPTKNFPRRNFSPTKFSPIRYVALT